jgi:membrane protease YdiL (CAAX protease family)
VDPDRPDDRTSYDRDARGTDEGPPPAREERPRVWSAAEPPGHDATRTWSPEASDEEPPPPPPPNRHDAPQTGGNQHGTPPVTGWPAATPPPSDGPAATPPPSGGPAATPPPPVPPPSSAHGGSGSYGPPPGGSGYGPPPSAPPGYGPPPNAPPGYGQPAPTAPRPAPPPAKPRPSALDATLLPLWILVGQVLAGIAILPGLLFAEDPETTGRILLAVSAVLGWGAVVVGTWLWLRYRGAWDRAWLVGHQPRSAWLPSLIGVGGAIGGFVLVQLVVGLLTWITGTEPPEQEIFELLDDPLIAWVMGGLAILVAPAVEEIVFRGVMLDVMARRWSWGIAAIAQAAVFSAIHIETLVSPAMFLALGLLGYLFAWLRRVTGSLIAPIVAHLVFNATSIGLATLGPEAPTTGFLGL